MLLKSAWHTLQPAQPTESYLAVLTYVQLPRWRDVPRFMAFSRQVEQTLTANAAVAGYALGAAPWARRFCTLSAWTDPAAVSGFVFDGVHQQAMLALPLVRPTLLRRTVPGNALPVSWSAALARLRDV